MHFSDRLGLDHLEFGELLNLHLGDVPRIEENLLG